MPVARHDASARLREESRKTKPGFLALERIVAPPGFNRWLVPPAGMAIHLCIGMAYGFSVFWLPLSSALGGAEPVPCGSGIGAFDELFVTHCDWRISTLGWMYTLFFVLLGGSAALCGGWVDRVGPRKAGIASALCWCGGLLVSALGVHLHQLWLLILGSGVIGGIGLGLGYISPISTLLAWFPDRRGVATRLAIMRFGGGAMIGSPLAVELMRCFASETSVGVAETFVVMALVYFVFMLSGALGYRLPPAGWAPSLSCNADTRSPAAAIRHRHVQAGKVWGIHQFWLVWLLLCMNVSAGIGLIGMASPMLQEIFGGALIGSLQSFDTLDRVQATATATVAAGFAGLLSLFNICGRLGWATMSDRLGRQRTFSLIFVLGALLYVSIPASASAGSRPMFVLAFCVVVSMYGGAFATAPAYLADLFGARMVGAIHARLLTALALAGIIGPSIVYGMRDLQLGQGMARAQTYNQTMYVLAGLLVVGFVCNLLVRPVADRHFTLDAEPFDAKREPVSQRPCSSRGFITPAVVGAWLAVVLPLAWGAYKTAISAARLLG